jgi:hypothetical protein
LAISGFSVGAHIILTNNTNEDKTGLDSNQKTFTLNSHMILREKNHQEVKEKITKKFKVPRDIREDFLIYESEDAKEKVRRYKLPLRIHKLRAAIGWLCKNSKIYRQYFEVDEEFMKEIEEDDGLFTNANGFVD